MAFTLPQFRMLLAIHERGSLGLAAPVIGVSQPALSRSLGELERQLGVLLFERHPSGMRPTPYTQAVLPYAANIVEESERALEEIRTLAGESHAVVRIGSISSAAASMLPPLIERLRRRMPGISVKVSEGVDEFLEAGLVARTFDIVIASHLKETEQIARAIDLKLGDLCSFLVGRDHPLRGRTEIHDAELLAQTWVALPPDAMPRKYFEHLMRKYQVPVPRIAVETRSIAVIRDLVAHQGFITWAPTTIYASNSPDRYIEALDCPRFQLRRAFHVYRLRRRTMSQAVREALSVLRGLATDPDLHAA